MNSINICIVDDHREVTDLLQEYLSHSSISCDVTVFNKPESAIDWLQSSQSQIHILITDFHMGKYTGLDILKASPDGILKIVLSGNINIDEINNLRQRGARFFEKPVPMKTILSEVESYSSSLYCQLQA